MTEQRKKAAAHPAAEDGQLSPTDLLVSVRDGRAAKVPLPYGTLYLLGTHAGIEGALVGTGGGFCWRDELREYVARQRIETAIENDETVTIGSPAELLPSVIDP